MHKKKSDNFYIMKEKIINHNQNKNNINTIQNNNQNNYFTYNPTFNPDLSQNALQQSMTMISQMYLMQGNKGSNMALNENMENKAPHLSIGMVNTPKPLNKGMGSNINENLNQNQYINIEFIFNDSKIVIQGTLDMTSDELIQKFKKELCGINIIINKYLINDEIEININSKKTLKELGINSDIKIMVK